MTRKNIYPLPSIRENALFDRYSTIAIEHYYLAKQKYEELLSADIVFPDLNMDVYNTAIDVCNNSIISVVFSAMCIESFLNNYAAACIGDKDFYDNFDKLSPEGKFKLISLFILKAEIDKGASYYCHLRKLFKTRNLYVHNKSQGVSFQDFYKKHDSTPMTLEEIKDLEEHPENYELIVDSKEQWKEENECISNAQNGIKAMRDIAVFFDTYDANVHAVLSLFNPAMNDYVLDVEHPLKRVLYDFDIPYEKWKYK